MDLTASVQPATASGGSAHTSVGRAKAAYTTRFVSRLLAADPAGYHVVNDGWLVPQPGDVVLARVETIGQHTRLERPDGRRATLFVGDEVLVAYGNRYAPDQFEAEVPGDLGPVHLVAAGGVAGRVISSHESMEEATLLSPLGLLADNGGVVTLGRCAPLRPGELAASEGRRPVTIAVLGTSMNSGKTTTVAAIVRGLGAAGLQVAAGKVTGTGAGGDPNLFTDSGASTVLDFTDFGYPSTYLLRDEDIRRLFVSILDELAATGADVVVIEVADGLLQRETAALIADPIFRQGIDGVLFAASEALGAKAGCAVLAGHQLPVLAVGGRLTASPLAIREAAEALAVPVYSVAELSNACIAHSLLTLTSALAPDALAAR